METIGSPEGKIYTWKTADRYYWIAPKTFTKRQLYSHEKRLNIYGGIAMIPWSRERLENEYKTLKFIAEHTTIPVPRILGYSVEGEVASLTLETIEGEIVSDLILDLGPEDKERLLDNVDSTCTPLFIPNCKL